MELEKLDLQTHLIKMGMPVLQEIIGKEELEAISLITNKNVNETMIADLLIKSNGYDIFSDALLRGYIIHFLYSLPYYQLILIALHFFAV